MLKLFLVYGKIAEVAWRDGSTESPPARAAIEKVAALALGGRGYER